MPKKSLQEKVREEYPEFAESCDSLSSGDLDLRLAELAKHAEDVENSKEADEGLKQLQAEATQAAAPYRDAKKAIKLKNRYIIGMLKERGGK